MPVTKLIRAGVASALVLGLASASSAAPHGAAPIQAGSAAALHAPIAPTSDATEAVDAGMRGGPIERMHDGCAFPEGQTAPDWNWTHGDYVSAWAHAGDHTVVPDAAHSDCGKHVKAEDHGGSSEDHGRSAEAKSKKKP
jgi:hypothetical protein